MIWFVVFHPKERHQWWGRRFGHVSLAGFKDDTWVHVDVGIKNTEIAPVYRYDDVRSYLACLTSTATVLKFGPAQNPGGSFFFPMTCVSFVKHVLGVRSRALRPDGLFEILIREYKAELMNEDAQTAQGERNPGAKATA